MSRVFDKCQNDTKCQPFIPNVLTVIKMMMHVLIVTHYQSNNLSLKDGMTLIKSFVHTPGASGLILM